MASLLNVFLLMWTATLTEGITSHSVTGCSDNIPLNCSVSAMIHVERITFYNGTDCNQAVTDLQVCGQPLTGSDTGLAPICTGKISCSENVFYSYCPGSKAARVDYRCISGNDVKDMCDEFIIENTNRIFLSTPNYPLSPTFTDISPCRCSIRGSSITSIQILEHLLLPSNDGAKSSLEINNGDVTYKTESLNNSTRRVYNKRLSPASTTAEIILNHDNIERQYLWIDVQGVSIRVSCNNDNNEKDVTTSSSSPTLTSPTSASSSSSSPTLISPTTSSSPTLISPTTSSSSPSPPSPSTSSRYSSATTSQPSSFPSPTTTSRPSSTATPPPSSTTPTSPTSSQSVPEEPNIEPSSSTDSSTTKTTHPPQTADIKSQDPTPVIAGSVVGAVILIAIVIIIFIFIYRKRSRNRSSTTKPHSAKMDKNPDEIPMDIPSRGQPDGCEIDEDITRVNNSVDVNYPDQTASPSNTDLVYAVVNKPGRTSSVDRESKSTDPDGTVVDTGSHYVHVDGDFVKDSKDSSKGNLNQTHKGKYKDSLKGNPQGSYEATPKDSLNGTTVNTVFKESDKPLDGERNSPVLCHSLDDIDPRYADINDLFKQDSLPSQSEDTPRADSSEVMNCLRSSRKDGVRPGGIGQESDHYSSIDQDTDHYSSIDQESDHYSSIDAIGPTDLQNVKPTVSDTDSKVSSDKTQGSSSTRAQEDSSYDPVYSVVNKVKASPKPDDNIPERIVIENELYVPFDDKSSDRIVIENDLYVPLGETLLKTA